MAPVDKDAEIVGGSDRRQKAEAVLAARGAMILNDVDFLGLRRRIRAGEKPVLLACSVEDRQVVEVRDFSVKSGIGSALFALINSDPVRLHEHNQQFIFGIIVENPPHRKPADIAGGVARKVKDVTEK